MTQIFFTSDTHFGHWNIVKYCGRPFKSIEEHDEKLIQRWNNRVGKNDLVYHLGDFCFGSTRKAEEYLDRLNGKKFLIMGNHDRQSVKAKGWEKVTPYHEIKVGTQQIVLFHYRMVVWNRKHYGAWALHGHSHGKLPLSGDYTLDVGVDCWYYDPITIPILEESFKLTERIRGVTYEKSST